MPLSAEFVRHQLSQARRVLVIKPSALGDVVQTLPILPALRRIASQAEIHWVIGAELRELVEGHPRIEQALPFYRGGGLTRYLKLLEQLSTGRYDVVLDLQGLLRTAAMSIATAAPVRIGLETAREGASAAVHRLVPQTGPNVPAHARYRRLLTWLGESVTDDSPQLPAQDAHGMCADRLLAGLSSPVIAIHPGAKWITKRWPPERFGEVVHQLVATTSAAVVLIGAPSESALAEDVMRAAGNVPPERLRNLSGRTRLLDLAALLAKVQLVISNDSGPMHLAAAMGTPVVGLFTCTSPVLSGPPPLLSGPTQHQLLAADVPCAASYRKQCPHPEPGKHACFAAISVSQVVTAALETLSSLSGASMTESNVTHAGRSESLPR